MSKLNDELESAIERLGIKYPHTHFGELREAMLIALQFAEDRCLNHCQRGESDQSYWSAANNCVAAIRRLQGNFR